MLIAPKPHVRAFTISPDDFRYFRTLKTECQAEADYIRPGYKLTNSDTLAILLADHRHLREHVQGLDWLTLRHFSAQTEGKPSPLTAATYQRKVSDFHARSKLSLSAALDRPRTEAAQ